jgi:ectoine hydroxylase-related dioxygenase (phytanoyl-CoA dioxygenase family)
MRILLQFSRHNPIFHWMEILPPSHNQGVVVAMEQQQAIVRQFAFLPQYIGRSGIISRHHGIFNFHHSCRRVVRFRSNSDNCFYSRPTRVTVAPSNPSGAVQRTLTTTTTTANSAEMAEMEEMAEMQEYLFDLNGYLIVRKVLTPEEVAAANAAIDPRSHVIIERTDRALQNVGKGSALYGAGKSAGPGTKDLGQVLDWGANDSRVFASILEHPRLVPLFRSIIGHGYRMNHFPFCVMQAERAEGKSYEDYPHLIYSSHHHEIRASLLGCIVVLTDHKPGDGGFCVVPGSHKPNFKIPNDILERNKYNKYVRQPATKAGDVVLFSEGTIHCTLPWKPKDRQQRVCLYRFAPTTSSHSRSYVGNQTGDGRQTDEQRAARAPPYSNRFDRRKDGTFESTRQHEKNKKKDRDVFFWLNYFETNR